MADKIQLQFLFFSSLISANIMVKEVYTHPGKIFPKDFGLTYWSLKMQIFKNQGWGKITQNVNDL